MKEFGLQLYSVRDHMENEEQIKDCFIELAKMSYSHVQTAGTYDFISPEKFAEYAHDAGLEICGTHYSWDKIKDDIEGTVAYHKALGTNNVGIGGMPGPARTSLEALNEFIDEFNRCAAEYAKHGMKLTYHNHAFEFKKFDDGKTIFDHLIERLDKKNVSFVLDTYWLQYGGKDIREMIERLSGRVDILHIKDMEAHHVVKLENGSYLGVPNITEIGSGNINFASIIKTAEACGVKCFVVEDDRAPSVGSYEAVKKSADYIKANLLEA